MTKRTPPQYEDMASYRATESSRVPKMVAEIEGKKGESIFAEGDIRGNPSRARGEYKHSNRQTGTRPAENGKVNGAHRAIWIYKSNENLNKLEVRKISKSDQRAKRRWFWFKIIGRYKGETTANFKKSRFDSS